MLANDIRFTSLLPVSVLPLQLTVAKAAALPEAAQEWIAYELLQQIFGDPLPRGITPEQNTVPSYHQLTRLEGFSSTYQSRLASLY